MAAVLGARAVEPLDDLTTSGRSTVVRLGVTGGEDAGAAEAALVAHASALGRLAAATRGRRAEYERLVREIRGLAALLEPSPSEAMLRDGWAAVERELPGLGLRVPAGVSAELDDLLEPWRRSPDTFSFSPGDVCPDNHVLVAGAVRFFDVDFCSFRPTALDAAYYVRPHLPTCNFIGELPEAALDQARAAFAGHAPVDEHAVCAASVAWTVLNAGWLLAAALAGDRRLGPTSFRAMLLWRLSTTAERCRATPALGTLLGDLAGVLAERWSEAGTLAAYPAFSK